MVAYTKPQHRRKEESEQLRHTHDKSTKASGSGKETTPQCDKQAHGTKKLNRKLEQRKKTVKKLTFAIFIAITHWCIVF